MPSSRNEDSAAEERLDQIFHALANRTRRAQLARLALGPATISELAAPFEMSLPAASKHLRVLERAGLVRRQIDGRVHNCSLDADPLRDVAQWTQTYRQFWTASLDALAEYLEGNEDE